MSNYLSSINYTLDDDSEHSMHYEPVTPSRLFLKWLIKYYLEMENARWYHFTPESMSKLPITNLTDFVAITTENTE